MLRILSEKKRRAFYASFTGKSFNVLFENEEKDAKMYGFTENYIKVETDYDPLLINEITQVTLGDLSSDGWAKADINYATISHAHVS